MPFVFKEQALGTARVLVYFLSLHSAAVAVFSYGMYKSKIPGFFTTNRNWGIFSAVVTFFFSMAGFISLILMYALLSRRRRALRDVYYRYESYIGYDFAPEKKFIDTDRLDQAIASKLEVIPVLDVLMQEDVQLRRGGINVLSNLPVDDAVRLLKYALSDRNVEIRFHAASELSRIETELNNHIAAAKDDLERNPDSTGAHLSLANSYAEYYESNLLDEVTADYYRDLAFQEYQTVLDMGGEIVKVMNYMANIEVAMGKHKEALARFKRVYEIEPYNVYANVGIVQCYFELGKVSSAIRYSKDAMKIMPETKGPMHEIISYWSS